MIYNILSIPFESRRLIKTQSQARRGFVYPVLIDDTVTLEYNRVMEVICEFCHKPIFGTDDSIDLHSANRSRVKYHEGCRVKFSNQRAKQRKLIKKFMTDEEWYKSEEYKKTLIYSHNFNKHEAP